MSDSQENQTSSGVPKWQRTASEDNQTAESSQKPEEAEEVEEDKLEVARRFLDDDEVKASSREKKVEFLKSKGIGADDIQTLLGEPEETTVGEVAAPEPEPASPVSEIQNKEQPLVSQSSSVLHSRALPTVHDAPASVLKGSDRPPVVTYPEFLTKPQRPPPLVTTDGLFNTLYAFAGLSTLLYGTSKYVVAPMVDSLTDARADLHETTSKKLDTIVSKLEKTVSVVPTYKTTGSTGPDDASDVDDPSEMFHRDIGTQTSLPTSPSTLTSPASTESEHKKQADRLAKLSKSLSGLKDDFRTQSSGLQDVKTLLDVFRDDLDGMTYGGRGDLDMYGKLNRSEPEDEIRKVRDNIRRIKGVLLSTRNFPASTR